VEAVVLPEPLQCSAEREGRTKEMEGHERDEKGRRIENGGEEGKRSDGPVVLTTAAHLCRFF